MEDKVFQAKLIESAKEIDIEISEFQAAELRKFTELMKEWNEKVNLTAIIDDEEILSKHLIDSLSLLKCDRLPTGARVIDIGTGAGFPAIPLKILRGDLEITLLDSLNKRLKYLDEVINLFSLKNTHTFHARAEDGGKAAAHRESYDVATARAVANLSTLLELCLPFVRVGGYFLCMKGPSYLEELEEAKNAFSILGGELESVVQTVIPGTELKHHILIIKKIAGTPAAYPRKAGTPSNKPLK